MNRFKTQLAVFMAGLPLIPGKGGVANLNKSTSINVDQVDPVQLRPLNSPGDNLFAAHRSHSSHRSHRSGSGGGSYSRSVPASPATSTPRSSIYGGSSSQPVDAGRPSTVSPRPYNPKSSQFTKREKLQLQIMRVQIALLRLGLYDNEINGKLDSNTKEAIKKFQTVKGINPDGLMSTETLNALGIPAVQ